MASLTKKDNSPYWYCCFTTPDGVRTKRSTKEVNRKKAEIVCARFEAESKMSGTKKPKIVSKKEAFSEKNFNLDESAGASRPSKKVEKKEITKNLDSKIPPG